MKKIIVFGATGGTGKQVVQQALLKGHWVTAVVRNTAALALQHERLEIVKGDVFQSHTFESAVAGKDVVISCLGIQKREPTTVYSEGVGNLVKAMQAAGIQRIICLSAAAVVVPSKSSWWMKFVIKNILQKIFKHSYADMLVMEKMLRESNVYWTVIRPPWLRNSAPTGKYRTSINESLGNPSKLSRADLASYIVDHAVDEKTFKAVVEISY